MNRLDTRTKIIAPQQALEAAAEWHARGRRVRVVIGLFDPLLASHARRIAQIAQPGDALFAVVEPGMRPVLPARARAELVAALRMVDYVVLDGDDPGWLAHLQAHEVCREESADEQRTLELIRHVQSRQN